MESDLFLFYWLSKYQQTPSGETSIYAPVLELETGIAATTTSYETWLWCKT